MKKNKQSDSTTEITKAALNGVTHLLIAETKSGNVTYTYQVYNAMNKSKPLIATLDLYNRLLELFTTKSFKNFNFFIHCLIPYLNLVLTSFLNINKLCIAHNYLNNHNPTGGYFE